MNRTQEAAWRAALVAIALVTAMLAPNLARAQSCGLKRLVSLDMEDNRSNIVVVPVGIEHTQRMMLVDTGGVVSMLSTKVVDELKLPREDTMGSAYMASGKTLSKMVTVRSVELGPVNGSNWNFMVENDADFNLDTDKVDGILSPDILGRFDLDFDYAAKKLNIMLQDHCPGQVVYWAASYARIPFSLDYGAHIVVPVTLDGKELNAIIDSGASWTALSTATAGQQFDLNENSPTVKHAKSGDYTTLHSLSFGGVTVDNPVVFLLQDKIGRTHARETAMSGPPTLERVRLPDLIIGENVLRKLHLYVVYKEHAIYVTSADAAWPNAQQKSAASPAAN